MIRINEMDTSRMSAGKNKCVFMFGRGEGSPVYDTLMRKSGESDRDFERRCDKKYSDDMNKKETSSDSRRVYMKYV